MRVTITLLVSALVLASSFVDATTKNIRGAGVMRAAAAAAATDSTGFVTYKGQDFYLNNQVYRFAGTNSYYITSVNKNMVDDLFSQASELGIQVLRTWAFNAIGDPTGAAPRSTDGSVSRDIYYQYYDSTKKKSAVNEGPNGVQRLDYVVKKAKDMGIKLTLVLTDNWGAFGGSEQYNLWHGVEHHDDFFVNENTRNEYKNWMNYLLNRVNTYTGVAYKDEPTIFAFELINEPSCKGCKDIPGGCTKCEGCGARNPVCSNDKIRQWVDEMSTYFKSIDKNHLLAVGDEGFINAPGETRFGYNGKDGDTESLVALPNIDFATLHAYPDNWGQSQEWTEQWYDDHVAIAKRHNKPAVFEEFNLQKKTQESNPNSVDPVRAAFLDTIVTRVCRASGSFNFWMLSAGSSPNDTTAINALYPDFDNYTIYFRDTKSQVTPQGQQMKDRIFRFWNKQC